ncbi:50S ribosomal protein L25/general stress protein Ctc [Abyssicoccus albus]|jgi:large subunit ribosomal protein L25|uniref:Large ribosomal subunit protein bL25 n=1 Tax=Abyssicoccus albus TaxID=1817405 RepID=A0A3N5C7W2_9BACL|nr:50S ribosomal protein L25/general stress protein Ctc [Abyssicoccus albus]RPF54475.1 LSU ribosomal protein L25P [Abyssicoccus albus]
MTTLQAQARKSNQTGAEKKAIREAGQIPGIIYGYNTENTPIQVDEVEFIKTIREVGRNGVIDLNIDSNSTKVMVAEYQFDSMKNAITHIDFIAINMTEERTVGVTIELVGEAVGAKEGGVVDQPLFELEVTATPANIPESIEVDVTELQIGDSIHVSDIKVNGDFTIEEDAETTVVSVVPPTEEPAEDEAAEEGTEQEVEVIGEEKEEEGSSEE